ncbi:MAG: hypothetical protein IPN22_14385 [Bacteroidetes bacterium]|nr:hypothetical protein [Bacteroidota bacterium]
MMHTLRYLITVIISLAGFHHLIAQAETTNPNSAAGLFWKVKGNSGTNSGIHFIGTTDNVSLRFRTNNQERMIIDSNGRVGIGTIVPKFRFNVAGGGPDTVLADFRHIPIYSEMMNLSSVRVKSGPVGFTSTLNSANALELLLGYEDNTNITRGIKIENTSSSLVNYGILNLAKGGGISVTDSTIGITSFATDGAQNMAIRGGAVTTGAANTLNIGVQGYASGATDNWAGYFGNNTTGDGLVFIKDALSIGAATPVAELYVGGINANVVVDAVGTGGASVAAPSATTDRLLYASTNGYVRAIPAGSTGQVLSFTASGPAWGAASANAWSITGNGGTNSNINFIGTTDNVPFNVRINNQKAGRVDTTGNSIWGFRAGKTLTTVSVMFWSVAMPVLR